MDLAQGEAKEGEPTRSFSFVVPLYSLLLGLLGLTLGKLATDMAGAPQPRSWPQVGGLMAMLALSAANFLALVGVVCLDQRQPFTQALADTAKGIIPEGVVVTLVNLAFGVLLVATLEWAPLALPVFLIPLV